MGLPRKSLKFRNSGSEEVVFLVCFALSKHVKCEMYAKPHSSAKAVRHEERDLMTVIGKDTSFCLEVRQVAFGEQM